jgi:ubiquinone/menaquinone biosynthesis C-methylase UbiE
VSLQESGRPVFGLDESRQMAHLASRRLRKKGHRINLIRGQAQLLPFQHHVFDTVVATFPAEYIYDRNTLQEAHRLLVPGGRLVILPMAWITGTHPLERLAAWLFRITGEAPGKPKTISAVIQKQFTNAGFEVRSEVLHMKGSQVLIVIATSA